MPTNNIKCRDSGTNSNTVKIDR